MHAPCIMHMGVLHTCGPGLPRSVWAKPGTPSWGRRTCTMFVLLARRSLVSWLTRTPLFVNALTATAAAVAAIVSLANSGGAGDG